MLFCSECEKDVPIGAKFCPSCGNSLFHTPLVATLNMSQEKVIYVLVLRFRPLSGPKLLDLASLLDYLKLTSYPKALASVYQYVLVITNLHCIFAQLTSQMFSEELTGRAQKAKDEGKGFFGRLKASHSINLNEYIKKYWNMEAEEILHETDGNYSIENSDIDSLEFITTIFYDSFLGHGYRYRSFKHAVEVIINSKTGRYSYLMFADDLDKKEKQPKEPYYPKDFDILQKIFGSEKIKLSTKFVETDPGSGP